MAGVGTIGLVARIGGIGSLVSELGKLNTGFEGTAQSAEALGSGLKTATTSFALFQAGAGLINTSLQSVQFAANAVLTPVKAVGSALGDLAELAGSASSKVVSALGDIAAAGALVGTTGVVGLGALGSALGAGVGAAIGVAARFQQELIDLRAITQETPGNIKLVEDAVKSLAQQFALSIPDIQRVALELAKAGVSPEAIANGVLKITLALQQLSKGELSAEQAGEGLGSLLQLFQRQFRESGQSTEEFSLRIGNAVLAVANNTRASIQEVINGVNTLAPTLTARGQDIESVFAALNVILSQGLRGEVGGTGLRNLFNFLVKPSQEALALIKQMELEEISPFDLQGNIRPALDVLRSIQKVFSPEGLQARGLTPAQGEQALAQIFQTRAATIAAIIRNIGPEQIDKFFEEFNQTNLIAQANEQLDGLVNQLKLVKNNAELAAIAFGQQFLGSLTDAGKAVNDFIKNRVTPGGSALGAGLGALITGQGGQGAFEDISTEFGQGAGDVFGNIFNQAVALRQPIESLLGDIGRLGDTLGKIIFPDGPGEKISEFGGLVQRGIALVDRFVNFLNSSLPTTGQNIAQLVGEAQQFIDKIGDIITRGKGLDELPAIFESLQPLIGQVRETFDAVATSAAGFVRTVLDNRDSIIAVLSTVVNLLGIIDRLLIGIADNATKFVTGFGGFFSAFGTLADRTIPRPKPGVPAFELFPSTQTTPPTGARRGPDVITPGERPPGPLTGPPFVQTVEPTTEDIERLNEANARAEIAAEGAAQALRDEADAAARAGASTGAIATDMVAAQRAAEQLTNAVERANERMTEAAEDAEKSQRQAFRQLERTLGSLEQQFNDTLESIAEQLEDSTRNTIEQAQRQRDELNDAFDIRQSQQERRDSFALEERDRRQAFDHQLEDSRRQRQLEREDRDTSAGRASEDALRIEQQALDKISRVRQQGIDRDNTAFQRGQEDRIRILTRSQEDAQRVLAQGFEEQNTTRLRGREDAEAKRQFGLDLSRATSPEERARLQQQFQDQNDQRTRQRGFEDEDRRIAREQEAKTLKFRREQEQTLLGVRRSQEDEAFARRIQQAEDEVQFRIEQELTFLRIRRIAEDAERQRRRIEDAREILDRRQIEEVAQNQFQDEAQRRQRAQEFQFAREDLDRALGKVDTAEQASLRKELEQAIRRVAAAQRTELRGTQNAQQSYNDSIQTSIDRWNDLANDIPRTLQNAQRALDKADPNREGKGSQAATNAAAAVSGAIASTGAVIGAGAITAQARGDLAIQALQDRLGGPGGLKDTANSALTGLINDIETLQSITEGTQGVITITTIFNSPQAERLANAIEELTTKINKIAPGVRVDQNIQQFTEPTTPEDALQGLATVGGVV